MIGRSFLPAIASASTALALALLAVGSPLRAQSAVAVSAVPAQRQQRTLRVMPLGDSITHGVFGFASYRYALWERLSRRRPVDFVGRLDTVANEGPGIPNLALYPQYYGAFEASHEGYAGARTDQLLGLSFAAALEGRPDVVLLQIGTNDVGQLGAPGIAQATDNLPRIVHSLRAANPAVRIVLAQIPPIGPGTGHFAFADLVPSYNLLVQQLALIMDRAASPIEVVDSYTDFDLGLFMQADGLHPNELGEAFQAERWEAGIGAVLERSGPPPLLVAAVSDPGFEQFGLLDGQAINAPIALDWGFGLTEFAVGGIFNPEEHTYPGSAGAGTPIGAEGDEVLFLAHALGAGERATVYQTLDATLSAGRSYSLTVSVGKRLASNPFLSVYGGYRLELLAGSTVLAVEEDEVDPQEGTFEEATLDFTASGIDPRLYGRPLTIRLGITQNVPVASTDFDRVRLVVQ